jgi:hypothetical protein
MIAAAKMPNRIGSATLRQDRKASMDLVIADLFAPTRLRLNATLGGAPVRVPGGSAELRVISDSELRMIGHLQTSSWSSTCASQDSPAA